MLALTILLQSFIYKTEPVPYTHYLYYMTATNLCTPKDINVHFIHNTLKKNFELALTSVIKT